MRGGSGGCGFSGDILRNDVGGCFKWCLSNVGFLGGRGGEGVRTGDDTKSSKSSRSLLECDVTSLEEECRRLSSERVDDKLASKVVRLRGGDR